MITPAAHEVSFLLSCYYLRFVTHWLQTANAPVIYYNVKLFNYCISQRLCSQLALLRKRQPLTQSYVNKIKDKLYYW